MTDGARRHELVGGFRRARAAAGLAVLEGFHPLKHALRFGAEVVDVLYPDPGDLLELARELAPDLVEELSRWLERGDRACQVRRDLLEELVPVVPHTGVVALARRPGARIEDVLAPSTEPVRDPAGPRTGPGPAGRAVDPAPMVLLDRPVHLGNLGACVRAAAAAGAAGLVSLGPHDPWHPDAIRGAAGLQFALPVGRVDGLYDLPEHDRPLVAVDPGGEPLEPGMLPPGALLAFGGEREGLAPEILEAAAHRLRIPMRPGVSSLNLASAVTAALYAWRWSAADAHDTVSGRRDLETECGEDRGPDGIASGSGGQQS